ncbi:MAG: hypothetical protein WC011_00590 [Candidatus Paceibacterota bacterium]
MISRIIYSVLVLSTILFWPFWISLFMIFIGMLYFNKYYEGLALIIIFESLYSVPEVKIFDLYFVYTISFFFVFVLIQYLKKKLTLDTF